MIKADLYGALARGYCSEKNSKKTVDQDLIEAMAEEIMLLLTPVHIDYDRSIHSNPDARAWAEFFCKCHQDKVDLETMTDWFANAMMAMHDYIRQNKHVTEK